MGFLYDLSIRLFVLALRLSAGFNSKAKRWVEGRHQWRINLKTALPPSSAKTLWVHAASLGEFEQGRPIIEAFRQAFPGWKIVLTFFSPSGYEIRKNYPYADLVCYLPADTRRDALDFLDLIRPDAAIFIKYEFWANYLFGLQKRKIPVLLVSALFRADQPFFRWYGQFWRKMLHCYTHIFVQDKDSGQLLESIGIQNFSIAGDTRVDQVLGIAAQAKADDLVQTFSKDAKVLVAGSTWSPDEAIIFRAKELSDPALKWVIAPHEASDENVQRISTLSSNVLRYSEGPDAVGDQSVLIIDNIGLLNKLYRYGWVAYIGGGFGKGIHNTLEPAAFGLPVIFGPKYHKFEEARQFVTRGGAFPVHNVEELAALLTQLQDPDYYRAASDAVLQYLEENRGATAKVMVFLKAELGTF